MSEFSTWAERQLALAGISPSGGAEDQVVHTSVMRLCQTFGEMDFIRMPDALEQRIITIFTELMHRRSLPVAGDTRRWAPSRQAPPGVGSKVRVRRDAFTGEIGRSVNGREAVVEGARRGEFIIHFTDGAQPDNARLVAAKMETQVG